MIVIHLALLLAGLSSVGVLVAGLLLVWIDSVQTTPRLPRERLVDRRRR